ncbi:hypothetical protein WIMU106979_24650 [Williamsia muralis]
MFARARAFSPDGTNTPPGWANGTGGTNTGSTATSAATAGSSATLGAGASFGSGSGSKPAMSWVALIHTLDPSGRRASRARTFASCETGTPISS